MHLMNKFCLMVNILKPSQIESLKISFFGSFQVLHPISKQAYKQKLATK